MLFKKYLNRRLAEALHIDDNSDPFNVRSTAPKYSDILKEDGRCVVPLFRVRAYTCEPQVVPY